jgi:hypothetical protein
MITKVARREIRRLLEGRPGWEVCGEAVFCPFGFVSRHRKTQTSLWIGPALAGIGTSTKVSGIPLQS